MFRAAVASPPVGARAKPVISSYGRALAPASHSCVRSMSYPYLHLPQDLVNVAQADRAALHALYVSADGDRWITSSTNRWRNMVVGVRGLMLKVSGGRVVEISLNSNLLKGEFPCACFYSPFLTLCPAFVKGLLIETGPSDGIASFAADHNIVSFVYTRVLYAFHFQVSRYYSFTAVSST